ncbi:hypothetical protein K503DRAFT_787611 [Rhizopogon vinicolor AM-OR11-026]|uniref:Uncharacterized protein n=1 Tax=Rhizopogon vinicolor AM-OR11-026 TaxID=1314800 RepID=A0A1B7MGT4_9AGAM|nr:hypothetical protein K503DRAFT_787611 [Rhizopogon vinicolor AM-OR11-026]
MNDISMDDETDAENDELTKNRDRGRYSNPYRLQISPTILEARAALTDLRKLLHPPRKDGTGYKQPTFDPILKGRLESMEKFLWKYADVNADGTSHAKNSAGGQWTQAADETARFLHGKDWLSRNLRTWSKAYINDRTNLPMHAYGIHNTSCINDEVLATDIKLHLQSIRKYVRAHDIVDYLKRPEVRGCHGLKKTVSLATAQWWMLKLDYRWREEKKGQYVDGHERDDVVTYHQNVFLPLWKSFAYRLRNWREDDMMFHDESTFYAHDRCDVRWVHLTEGAIPKLKGEGASLMVANFISADYGWLQSEDVKESACILFRAAKGWDGYFTTENILAHATLAMDILDKHFPQDDHILVFDNATTHTWGPTVIVKDACGNVMHDPGGKPIKEKICMANSQIADGTYQSFYFPEGHEKAGWFKGMAQILSEQGFNNSAGLRAECPGFKCPAEKIPHCCCRRLLYNQPDFVNVKSHLEILCEGCGFRLLLLSKFHCKLNFIEMCWGYAKRIYRQYDLSSKENDLECNVIAALNSIPLATMRKFAIRARHFIDAYDKGLDGSQAAWAMKKYRGHRVLPDSIMCDFDTAPTSLL